MYLLDTHAFYWFMTDDQRLGEEAGRILKESRFVSISIVSFWEIAIKNSIGKLRLPTSISEMMNDCQEMDIEILPIKSGHLELLSDLPKIHGDPFDRLLICQAVSENMTIITRDANIMKYSLSTIW